MKAALEPCVLRSEKRGAAMTTFMVTPLAQSHPVAPASCARQLSHDLLSLSHLTLFQFQHFTDYV